MNLDETKLAQLNKQIYNNPIAFAKLILGIELHEGQVRWIKNSTRRINILRPGNRYGKSLIAAIKHVWQCMCKPNLAGRVFTTQEWLRVEYQTLNFGPTYELGRGVLQLARDLVQGNVLMPGGKTNHSLLADWAITDDRSNSPQLPYLEFKTGARLLGRSYSEMGVAFKMKSLAFITGDECGDINELWIFTNNTLLPRVVDLDGSIDLVGTPQPEGTDYMRMIEMAEEDMRKPDWKENGLYYTQKGSMYDNPFIPKTAIEEVERIADPSLREQIIRGESVESREKYFGFTRIQNAVADIQLLEQGLPGRKYITAVDFAGGDSAWADYTVIMTVDYTTEPYHVVYFNRFQGGDISIPMQYKLVEEVCLKFGGKGRIIIDSSALGGKNAMAFLSHLNPISAEYGATQYSTKKAEMLATLKIAFDGGQTRKRVRVKNDLGDFVDENPDWGLLKIPNNLILINELQNYKLDDAKIRTDCVMTLAMAIHWIEMRRPKVVRRRAVDFDFY